MKKGLLACAVLLALAVLTCGMALLVSAETPTSGTCGAGVTWELNGSTLSIDGSGEMENYSSSSPAPWSSQASQIEVVLVYEGVSTVGDYAFAGCENLTGVSLYNTVGLIGAHAFEDCFKLERVTYIGNSLKIGDYAFSGCERLTSVPTALEKIGKYAFEGCTSFETFKIPDSVTVVSEGMFKGCTALKRLEIFDDVTQIDGNVLDGCSNLTRVVYHGSEDDWSALNKPEEDWCDDAKIMRFHDFCAHEGTCDCGVSAEDNNDYHHFDPEDEGEVRLEPTHTTEGVKIYKCVDCDKEKSEIIPAKVDEHTWGGEWVKKDDLEHEKACECGDKMTEAHSGSWEKVDDTNHKKVCKCGHVVTGTHAWSAPVITPATHTQEGAKTYTCNDCKATKIEKIAKLPDHTYGAWADYNESQHKRECECGDEQFRDHVWNDGVVTKQPTHTEEGVTTFTCRDCGGEKTEAIAKLPAHTYSDHWVNHDEEQHKKTCACGDAIYEEHTWDVGERTSEPTHLEFGTLTFTCSDCGATKTEDIPKLTEHTYGDWEKHNQSQHKKSCACGDVLYRDHDWDAGETVKEPTHTVEGVTKHVCADCGETKNVPIAKLTAHTHGTWSTHDGEQHKRVCACGDTRYAPHRWNDGEVKKAATHTAEGSILYTCADCGQTQTETLPKMEAHTFGKWKQGEDGHEKSCNCGAVMHEDHSFGKWTLITPATAEEVGVRERACEICGAVQREELPMLENSTRSVLGTGSVIGITVSFAVLLGVGGFWFVSPELIGDSTFVSKKKKKVEEQTSVDEETTDDID